MVERRASGRETETTSGVSAAEEHVLAAGRRDQLADRRDIAAAARDQVAEGRDSELEKFERAGASA